MKAIRWTLNNFEEIVSSLLLFVIFLLLGGTIIFRLFGISTTQMQEMTQYGFVLSIFFGISFAAKKNEHIRADIILSNVSEKVRNYMVLTGNFVWLAFTLGLAWYSIPFIKTMITYSQATPFLNIPFWVLYSFIPFTAVLTAVRIVQTGIIGLIAEIRRSNAS